MPDTIFSHREQSGTTMIEVLVTMVVLAMGLLGVAALQTQMQLSEMESYQRSQALILLNDMTGRIAANRYDATAYVTTSPLGAGMTCSTSSSTRQQSDTAEWCDALQGVAEVSGVNRVGAMVGARGCVESISAGATWSPSHGRACRLSPPPLPALVADKIFITERPVHPA